MVDFKARIFTEVPGESFPHDKKKKLKTHKPGRYNNYKCV